jgi:hypothetical protein
MWTTAERIYAALKTAAELLPAPLQAYLNECKPPVVLVKSLGKSWPAMCTKDAVLVFDLQQCARLSDTTLCDVAMHEIEHCTAALRGHKNWGDERLMNVRVQQRRKALGMRLKQARPPSLPVECWC